MVPTERLFHHIRPVVNEFWYKTDILVLTTYTFKKMLDMFILSTGFFFVEV